MNVSDFLDRYEATTDKVSVFNELEIEHYLPFTVKRQMIENMLENILDDDNGIVTYDSMTKYILFTIGVISMYTDLEFSKGDAVYYEYDRMVTSGLLGYIYEEIEDDYRVSLEFFERRIEDVMRVTNSLECRAIQSLNDIEASINKAFENVDPRKIELVSDAVVLYMNKLMKK